MLTVTSFSAADVIRACKVWGADLQYIPDNLDAIQLMWAFANKESTHEKPGFFGCKPRYEPAYFTGGIYGATDQMKTLISLFGVDAACSYGPWQVMLCNAPKWKPDDFQYIDICAEAFVGYLNDRSRKHRPQNLYEFGQLYNGGHISIPPDQPLPQVQKYCQVLEQCYKLPIPEQ
jgi:hypothetical protein